MWAYKLSRWKNVAFMTWIYQFSQRFPNFMKKGIVKKVSQALGPDYDVQTHFTPRYKPWEQRMCLVPNADMFEAIKANRASVVTDQIGNLHGPRHPTRVRPGAAGGYHRHRHSGLVMQAFGGIELSVDGRCIDIGQTLSYKGVKISGVPNMADVFG